MIMLSRNSPVAYVAGAAGFIGSHTTEKLLKMGVQVVGVDDLSSGCRENLGRAAQDKNFHFIHRSMAEEPELSLPRLDYAFFILPEDLSPPVYRQALENFLQIAEKYSAKIVLVSSLDLYDSHHRESLHNLKAAEEKIARFSLDKKANARVVRLSAVFGPRMHFKCPDPICRLVEASARDDLQSETTPLDFTTRSLFIDDAVSLLVKAVMHGATAQKIYDGARLYPVKATEIKQVLLDPLWHERKGFTPTELPPWPSPNLLKTERELSWKPRTSVVGALRETIAYFKENPGRVRNQIKPDKQSLRPDGLEIGKSEDQSIGVSENRKTDTLISSDLSAKQKRSPKFNHEAWMKLRRRVIFWAGAALVVWAFFYPFGSLAFDGWQLQSRLQSSAQYQSRGELDKATNESELAQVSAASLSSTWSQFGFLKMLGISQPLFVSGERLAEVLNSLVGAQRSSVEGTKALVEAMRVVSGEKEGDSSRLFAEASYKLDQAAKALSFVEGQLNDPALAAGLPNQLEGKLTALKTWVGSSHREVAEGQKGLSVLSQIMAGQGKKEYLVLLTDNSTLRPAGGVARAFAQVTFDKGKIADIKTGEVGSLDQSFAGHVEPPAELRSDLGVNNWILKDFGTDLDFPASARMAQWFFQKESGARVMGVIVLDIQTLTKLGESLGAESTVNLQTKMANSDTRDKPANAALKDVLDKVFFLSQQNWVSVGQVLGQSVQEKHLLVYVSDPGLFSYLTSAGWSGVVPRQVSEGAGGRREFLALSETNMSGNPNNLSLSRSLSLQSNIDAAGGVSHKLTVSYSNQGSSGSLLSDTYRNRLKAYLPVGTKLSKATWGSKNILKDVKSFSDFGRAGYSMFLELKPKEQKNLVLEYQDVRALAWEGNQVKYRQDIFKQPGTGTDKLEVKISYPFAWKAGGDGNSGEQSFSTDLSQDRSFEVTFTK